MGLVSGVQEGMDESEEDEDWEVEMVSVVVEAIGREESSEDVGAYLMFVRPLYITESPY